MGILSDSIRIREGLSKDSKGVLKVFAWGSFPFSIFLVDAVVVLAVLIVIIIVIANARAIVIVIVIVMERLLE